MEQWRKVVNGESRELERGESIEIKYGKREGRVSGAGIPGRNKENIFIA